MIKHIIFDFDGVILDSIPVKTEAFRTLFKSFPQDIIDTFIAYHLENGGKSRYLKIKYFFNTLLDQEISQEEIIHYAHTYSTLTKKELSKEKYIIQETLHFIQTQYKHYHMHIASGADENDLKSICNHLDLNQYFISIHGSPTPKSDIIKNLLCTYHYHKEETILIGDSINDFDAAQHNNITFYGFNNMQLSKKHKYIHDFGIFL